VVVEAAVVALMFPIVQYIVVQIGLPWLHELKRYSEVQRQKVHEWIDEQSRAEGLDPDAVEAAATPSATNSKKQPAPRPVPPGSAWPSS